MAGFPLPELLLCAHRCRFSGVARFESSGLDRDRMLLVDGEVVGLEHPGRTGVWALAEALVARAVLEPEEAGAFLAVASDGVDFADRLRGRGLVGEAELRGAAADRARRWLFRYATVDRGGVEIEGGVDQLGRFLPLRIDPQPVVAYGFIGRGVPGGPSTRRALGRRVWLNTAYDREANRFGLPPALVRAMERLSPPGLRFGGDLGPLGLDAASADGLLGWLERVGALESETGFAASRAGARRSER